MLVGEDLERPLDTLNLTVSTVVHRIAPSGEPRHG